MVAGRRGNAALAEHRGRGGHISGQWPGSLADRVITGLASAAVMVPVFLLALILLGVFSYTHFLWIQPGYAPLSHGLGRWLGRMILPWIALAAAQAGLTARVTRTAIIVAAGEDYVRTAQAKGMSRRYRAGAADRGQGQRPHGHHGDHLDHGHPDFPGQPDPRPGTPATRRPKYDRENLFLL
jgi:Binding-protein-dependent transport system inner membrane component